MKKFTQLESFSFRMKNEDFVTAFIHDLPQNLLLLKHVSLGFSTYLKFNSPDQPKLHMNSVLEWLISLPNLEEFQIKHYSFDYCHCAHLQGYQSSQKLRIMKIIETSKLSADEAEYTQEDLEAILSVIMNKNIEELEIPIHLEGFKQNAFDLFSEKLLQLSKLRTLKLTLWFNILDSKTIVKIQKLLADLYYVEEKVVKIKFFRKMDKDCESLIQEITSKKHQYSYSLDFLQFRR